MNLNKLTKVELINLVTIYEQNTEQIIGFINKINFTCTLLKLDLAGFRERIEENTND